MSEERGASAAGVATLAGDRVLDVFYPEPRLGAEAKPGTRPSKEPDPNSPFAKLAALKQQLEDNAKR